MMSKRLAAVAALGAALATPAAQAAQLRPCLAPAEAQAFVTLVAPEAIRQVAMTCSASLPAGAVLRRDSEALARRFEAAAPDALPLAQGALQKMVGTAIPDPALIGPLVKTLVGPLIAAKLKPQDCATIDRALGLIEPLPTGNMAGLIMLGVELAAKEQSALVICPPPASARRQ